MASLLFIMFTLQLAIHIINTVAASSINELLWTIYNKLPTPTAGNAEKTAGLRREVLRLKRELNATSAQDDFAKWAKLRRAHDKASSEYEKTSATLNTARSQFESLAGIARWVGTNGLRFLVQFRHTQKPMFWIPAGWLPWYIEWLLCFPSAPIGSVSIQAWGLACGSVVALAGEVLTAAYVLMRGQGGATIVTEENEKQAQKQAVAGRGAKRTRASPKVDEGIKKEL